ncbi:hypothetical protein AKJ09_04924 [Labilithrix luteola]|uniref:Tryptophan synthase alpha chain n=1 Tax=Labilithrix luteola TaxID=1391654 RepID=A0A0K1PXK7_9BACT|nr:hypothetical protein [Labilithrix luteola]AKU98260.1 hypothetical protein AKJ09_04924 [Labilithrix luteola]
MKNFFVLASVVVIPGALAFGAVAGCSSSDDATTDTTGTNGDAGGDGGSKDATPDTKPNRVDPTPTGQEEGTVGKVCSADSDCEVAGSVGDNSCSTSSYPEDDTFNTPVCIQAGCTVTANTLAGYQCDGTAGYCYTGGGSGTCLPFCSFDSTSMKSTCQGNNHCVLANAYSNDGVITGFGFCFGGCMKDADCNGTPGQKCQLTTGTCVAQKNFIPLQKQPGDACTAGDACNCDTLGGSSANKDKGICRAVCTTGAEGDTFCGTTTTNGKAWTCTAGLPTSDGKGSTYFTGQPDGLRGICAQPCEQESDCTFAVGTIGQKCTETSNGKYCLFPQ